MSTEVAPAQNRKQKFPKLFKYSVYKRSRPCHITKWLFNNLTMSWGWILKKCQACLNKPVSHVFTMELKTNNIHFFFKTKRMTHDFENQFLKNNNNNWKNVLHLLFFRRVRTPFLREKKSKTNRTFLKLIR